jgi:hypothetical protein
MFHVMQALQSHMLADIAATHPQPIRNAMAKRLFAGRFLQRVSRSPSATAESKHDAATVDEAALA